mmetsp:Transcript_79420/g.128660  ORF Transcript_79420/g.128660 Transcript_79420/m.128660 type:complete len:87 (-) Transcript_79420:182-442(-)
MFCSVLQCAAMCCSVSYIYVYEYPPHPPVLCNSNPLANLYRTSLQHTATHYNTPVCCSIIKDFCKKDFHAVFPHRTYKSPFFKKNV